MLYLSHIYIFIYIIHIDEFAQVLFACSILWPPPFLLGGWTSYEIFKNEGGLTEFHFLEEGYLERGQRGGKLLKRGCSFYINNKLKSEMFNNKKVY